MKPLLKKVARKPQPILYCTDIERTIFRPQLAFSPTLSICSQWLKVQVHVLLVTIFGILKQAIRVFLGPQFAAFVAQRPRLF